MLGVARRFNQMTSGRGPQSGSSSVPKNGVSWLLNTHHGKACSFTNANPTAHAQWVVVDTRPLRGSGQPVIRRMLRHNAIEAWTTMQESAG